MKIRNCSSCQENHDDIGLTEFTSPVLPWTHWYLCPVNEDPVNVCVKARGKLIVSAAQSVTNNLVQAEMTGSYLAAIFRVDSGQLMLERVTHNFPINEFGKCVEMLQKNLLSEAGPPEEVPLQKVDPPMPSIQPFAPIAENEGGE